MYSALYSKGSNELIRNIILIDDGSDMPENLNALEAWASLWDGRIQLLRSKNRVRQGLIRARLAGAQFADEIGGPNSDSELLDLEKSRLALTFLDAHCESADHWLEPLVHRVALKEKTFVTPVIDVLDHSDNYNIRAGRPSTIQIGCFNMKLDFNWLNREDYLAPTETSPDNAYDADNNGYEEYDSNSVNPKQSPAMAGGLFTVMRNTFVQFGTYDQGMKIWGGENIEMSLRVWMCDGSIEILPCSHVGHIFRNFNAHQKGLKSGTSVGSESERNKARTAKIWFDPDDFEIYKKLDSWANRSLLKAGDLTDRLALKQNLKCKSSDWYFKHIYPELWRPNLSRVDNKILYGRLQNLGTQNCLFTTKKTAIVETKPCVHSLDQNFYYDENEQGRFILFPDKYLDGVHGSCLVTGIRVNSPLQLDRCTRHISSQQNFILKDASELSLKAENDSFMIVSSFDSKLCATVIKGNFCSVFGAFFKMPGLFLAFEEI